MAAGIGLVAGGLAEAATVTLSWRHTMGVTHPEDAQCDLPELAPAEVAASNAAIGPAASAYRRALELAVGVAVAQTAMQCIDVELQATQRRLRGIKGKRVPALEGALRTLELQLEELEREDRVVTRWAQQRQPAR